jgi:hypothetical protein
MICVNFPSFKARFATRAVMSMPQTFDFTAPDEIDSNGVAWGSESPPYVAGMTLIMAGSASGNDTFTIASIAGDVVTTVEQTVANEATVTMSLCEGVTFEKSGWEQWPVEYMRVGDTAATFDGGITGYGATPYDGGAIALSANATAADAAYGVDEYDWYLSQRTDVPASQYLSIVQGADGVGPVSHSGSCVITPTALAEAKFGFSVSGGVPIDPDITRMLFRGCDIYVRRISDQAIQRADMLRKVAGN